MTRLREKKMYLIRDCWCYWKTIWAQRSRSNVLSTTFKIYRSCENARLTPGQIQVFFFICPCIVLYRKRYTATLSLTLISVLSANRRTAIVSLLPALNNLNLNFSSFIEETFSETNAFWFSSVIAPFWLSKINIDTLRE